MGFECARPPLSLEDAEAIIEACAGTANWQPLFLTGLATAAVVGLVLICLIQAFRSVVE